jgi:uncharacterized membrane protein HdeD (DUF308 family)
MVLLGVLCLILGFVLGVSALYVAGFVLLVVGLILNVTNHRIY